MADVPPGTVTFLFTDIEGSTRLWEQHPEAMPTALARHDALLGRAIEDHGGRVFKSVGDQLCAVFESAVDALAAAHEAQGALRVQSWGEMGSLLVRMALHSGPAEQRGEDYFGATLNRLARLLAAGHGGQILLSQAAADRVRAPLPEGATLRDLGTHRLKDLQEPERIFQFVPPGTPMEFPPLRSLEAFAHNLPRQTTRFIGRWPEMAAVRQLLSSAAILTLTGAGGCGKTRLALQVAAEMVEEHGDGAWLVELAALSDPELLVPGVATALGLREEPQRPILATLMDYLRPRSLLLLLDNCEHLLGACAQLVDTLLKGCPQLRVLATSREALGIPGEQTYRVPSLTLPDSEQPATLESLEQSEAVLLFRDRASLSEPSFALNEVSSPHVVHVCRRLDGIPLAIELAAARVNAVPVEQLAARLDDRFRLLTGGSRTALPRLQTLRGCLDWSYHLLSEPERVMLWRLSVFAGGWTLEAAEAVCSDPDADPIIQATDVLDLIGQLINKSLVTRESGEGEARYVLLEMIRQYAGEKLLEAGGSGLLRRRHRDWYLALAEAAEPQLLGPGRREWLERLEAEHPNLRAALDWCASEEGEAEAGQRLVGAAAQFWVAAGHFQEGRERLTIALSRPGRERGTAARAKALLGAANVAYHLGDFTAVHLLCEESLAIGRDLGERASIAYSLAWLGEVAYRWGDFPRSRQCYEDGLAIFREIADRQGAARMVNALGSIAHEQGEIERARALYEESLAMGRELGDLGRVLYLLDTLGSLARNQGDYARARSCHQESLAICREDRRAPSAFCLLKLGLVALEQGDTTGARSLFLEALASWRRSEDPRGIAGVLTCLAACAAEQGDLAQARTFGEDGLATRREINDRPNTSWSLAILAGIVRQESDLRRARALCEESLAISREMVQMEGIAVALAGLGDLDLVEGEAESAHQRYHESLALFSQMGYRRNIAACLVGLARVAEGRAESERSARLLGAAQALVEAIGARLGVVDRTEQERCEAAVRAALGEEAFAAARAEGRSMTLQQAVEYALQPEGTAAGE
jgi:predicted ATPase/class 3 adenylate cyclase